MTKNMENKKVTPPKIQKVKEIYYTIFLGDKPWENVVDDMNSTEIWGRGGMYWKSKAKAKACMKNLQHPAYGFETDKIKFSIKEIAPTQD